MLNLHSRATIKNLPSPGLFKVVTALDYAQWNWPLEHSALWLDDPLSQTYQDLWDLPWGAGISLTGTLPNWNGPYIGEFHGPLSVAPGDIIAIRPDGMIAVRYRRGSNSNVLFLTGRCNNRCRMCSQPPVDAEEPHLQDVLRLIHLIDKDASSLGITGGEPTLPGIGLEKVLSECKRILPNTAIQVLTNGRPLADLKRVQQLVAVRPQKLFWSIPIFADTAERHDRIAEAAGAFEEMLDGLYNLAEYGEAIELRVILQKPTVARLAQTAYFIFRNLPFVRHVAFMGLEPMGYARNRWEELWIDPMELADTLEEAAHFLLNRGMAVSLYNLPLCVIPSSLKAYARQSISDWKNMFSEECEECIEKLQCAGFFASAAPRWRSRGVRPITLDRIK